MLEVCIITTSFPVRVITCHYVRGTCHYVRGMYITTTFSVRVIMLEVCILQPPFQYVSLC